MMMVQISHCFSLSQSASLHACSLVHSCDGNTYLRAKSSFKPSHVMVFVNEIYIYIWFLDCGCTDIRVSFKLPLGKTRYESHEDRGYVEVCLILLSDYQAVLSTAVTVTLSPARTSSTIFVRGKL